MAGTETLKYFFVTNCFAYQVFTPGPMTSGFKTKMILSVNVREGKQRSDLNLLPLVAIVC